MASLKIPALIRMTRSLGLHEGPYRLCHSNIVRTPPVRPPQMRSVLGWRTFASEETKQKTDETEKPQLSESEVKCNEQLEALNNELKVYKEKSTELEDKYKRSLADGENLRKRMSKQIEDAKIFSIQTFCKDLLAVADTLATATNSVPKDQLSETNPHLKSLFEGLTLTEAQLTQVFKRHGLEAVNPIKEKFDPNLHEALFVQEVQGAESGTVVVVSKVGYKLQERCVRPALVGVAK